LWLCNFAAAISERTDTRATLEGGTAASMCCCHCLLVAKISVRGLAALGQTFVRCRQLPPSRLTSWPA
jgi:hypothetical protein